MKEYTKLSKDANRILVALKAVIAGETTELSINGKTVISLEIGRINKRCRKWEYSWKPVKPEDTKLDDLIRFNTGRGATLFTIRVLTSRLMEAIDLCATEIDIPDMDIGGCWCFRIKKKVPLSIKDVLE